LRSLFFSDPDSNSPSLLRLAHPRRRGSLLLHRRGGLLLRRRGGLRRPTKRTDPRTNGSPAPGRSSAHGLPVVDGSPLPGALVYPRRRGLLLHWRRGLILRKHGSLILRQHRGLPVLFRQADAAAYRSSPGGWISSAPRAGAGRRAGLSPGGWIFTGPVGSSSSARRPTGRTDPVDLQLLRGLSSGRTDPRSSDSAASAAPCLQRIRASAARRPELRPSRVVACSLNPHTCDWSNKFSLSEHMSLTYGAVDMSLT
jgi:hypothetical protein